MKNNQDNLLNELKKRIAISSFELENADLNENQIVFPQNIFEDWRKYIMNKKKILNAVGIFVMAIVLLGISSSIYAKIQWNIGFNEYQNREYQIGLATIKDAEESGYVENIDMEYIVQDNIGVKIDSLLITDEHLEVKVNFKFPENMEINTKTFSYGFAIYDNENNIYGISNRLNIENIGKNDTYTPYMYEEIGIDYRKNDIYSIQLNDFSGNENILAENHTLISKISMGSSEGFPKSKKLFIRINDLGFTMIEVSTDPNVENLNENFDVSDSEWIFEIDVPEKFYERFTTELTLNEEIPGLSIEKIAVSEVGLIVRGTLNGFDAMLKATASPNEETNLRKESIYITDETGNKYYEKTSGLVGNKDWFRMNFEITKNMLNQKLFLNVKSGEQVYISELIVK